jgi:hypothetical protein
MTTSARQPLVAEIVSLSRRDGWYAGEVRFSTGRRKDFFVTPSGKEVRFYGGGKNSASQKAALLIALGFDYDGPPPTTKAEPPPRVEIQIDGLSFTMSNVAKAVADAWGYTLAELRGDGLDRRLTRARQEAYWHIRQIKWSDGSPRFSYPQIGKFFNKVDHSAVHHGVVVHAARLAAQQQERAA